MLRQYMRHMLKSKSTAISIILFGAYWMIGLAMPNTLALTAPLLNPNITEANYYGFFSCYSVTFILIPFFLMLLQSNRRFFDSVHVVVRVNKYIKLHGYRLAAIAAESAFTLFYLYFLILIRQAWYKPAQIVVMLPIYLKCAVLQFLGLMCLALLYLIISSILKNGLFGMLCCIILAAYDYTESSGPGTNALFIARTLYMHYESITYTGLLITVLYMAAIIAALFIIGYNILNGREYLK